MFTQDSRFELKSIDPTGAFSGYGSVYDVTDNGADIVASGAFTKSLAEHSAKGTLPAMLWQHNTREPIGAYTSMREDGKGLYVEGTLAMKTQRGAEAHDLLKMKALSGLSIGFLTRDDSWDHKTGVRTIKQADLWEVSLVTFPMNDQARVDAVKHIDEIESRSDVERFLREVGVSRSEAKAMTNRLWALARREVANGSDEGESHQAILDALKRHNATYGVT